MFGKKKLELRIKELEEMQKKGYYGNNENNEYLKEVYRYAYQLSEFSETNNAKLVNYYKNNAVVRGLLGTQIGDTIAEISDYIGNFAMIYTLLISIVTLPDDSAGIVCETKVNTIPNRQVLS